MYIFNKYNMTHKEKAKELVNKFLQIYDGRVPQAKQCALICIDEKIKTAIDLNGEMFSGFVERLQEVKQEII